MTGALRLENPIRNYAWGSDTFIPELLGVENPDHKPWAELWIGAHPAGSSTVEGPFGPQPLGDRIADDPEGILGESVIVRHGLTLPFLFKILAAAKPLSIQCHPSLDQANEGFHREEAAGIELSDPRRNYKDRNHKPELLVALTPFTALMGFRPPLDIVDGIAEVGVESLQSEVETLMRSGDVRMFFAGLMSLAAGRRKAVLTEIDKGVSNDDAPTHGIIRALRRLYPDDIAVLAPLYLNLVRLDPGDGVFVPSGQLHAYVHGAALEIMSNSDNVLRGGLTPKNVDVPELLRVLTFSPRTPQILQPISPDGRRHTFPTPAREFALSYVDVRPNDPYDEENRNAVEIVLCSHGGLQLVTDHGKVPLPRGHAALLPAACRRVRFEGDGRAFIASVP